MEKYVSVIFIECTELILKIKYVSGLFVYFFFKNTAWYLGVIGKVHNNECLIYIFIDEVLNGTPNIFTNSQYHLWYKYLRGQFSPELINNTHYNVSLFIKLKGKFLKYKQLMLSVF